MFRPSLLVLFSEGGLPLLFANMTGEGALDSASKLARLSFLEGGWSPPAIWDGCRALVATVAAGDGETPCSKVRSDEVKDGASCGAKKRHDHAVSPITEQGRPSTFPYLPSIFHPLP